MFHQLLSFKLGLPKVSSARVTRGALATMITLATCLPGLAHANAECKVLVMGDSLSAAYGLPVEQGWVALMEARIEEKFPECSVVNGSVSGETTAGGRTRLPALLLTHQPSLMILELGANDGLRGLPLIVMKNNLTAMIQTAKEAGVASILVGMQIPANYGPRYTSQFKETFAQVAQAEDAALVPFMLKGFATNPDAFQSDGIHPTAAVQPTILNTLWPAIERALQ